jgi:hypothetical protein
VAAGRCRLSPPTATSNAGTVGAVLFNGIGVRLAPGWFVTAPVSCGAEREHSVTAYPSVPRAVACPDMLGRQNFVQAMQLSAIFGPWGSTGWSGRRTTWKGQPAWIS